MEITDQEDMKTPIPSINTIVDHNLSDTAEIFTHKPVILQHFSPSINDTIDITLEINYNAHNCYKQTFNYNPLAHTPSIIASQIINNLKISSIFKSKIERSIIECININEYNTKNKKSNNDIMDIFDLFENHRMDDEKEVMNVWNHDGILIEDILSVYSFKNECYIDVGCIVCNKYLYLMNANKLQKWKQFEIRTNIQYIMKDRNRVIIDDDTAIEILNKLNITNDSDEYDEIKSYLLRKSMKQIKEEILMQNEDIYNIFRCMPCIKQIQIENFYDENIVCLDRRYDILKWILNDAMRFEEINNDLWITFNEYITEKRLNEMNERLNDENIMICAVIDGDDDTESVSSVIGIDLEDFTDICVMEYGFVMKMKGDNDILCCVLNRNKRFEWIAYIDDALYRLQNELDSKEMKYDENQEMKYDRFMYTFNERNHRNEDEYVDLFGFGTDLNYWKRSELNYVSPKYLTLKDELILNKMYKMNETDYYALVQRMKIKIKKRQICAKCSGNDIEKGDKWTMNHAISMGVFVNLNVNKEYFLRSKNMEIAHLCRYLKECCLYFSEKMSKKAVYIGIDSYLLFNSLQIEIKRPLMVTMDSNIAKMCKNALILSLKPAFNDTRCFYFGQHVNSRIIYSAQVIISNLFIHGVSHKLYICAIQLFESICAGYLSISHNETTENTLYSLICDYLSPNNDNNNNKIPMFIGRIFANVFETKRSVWINKSELQCISNDNLRHILYDFGAQHIGSLFKSKSNMKFIERFEWKMKWNNDNNCFKSIEYDDECCCFYFIFNLECGVLRFIIKEMASNLKGIKVEMDVIIICRQRKFHIVSAPKWITHYHDIDVGIDVDADSDFVHFIFGIKIIDSAQTQSKMDADLDLDLKICDIDVDALMLKMRNELLSSSDIRNEIEHECKQKYKTQIHDLHETINLLLQNSNHIKGTRLTQSKSYSHIALTKSSQNNTTPRRKKAFALMDNT